jgi:pseudouridine-5'-phosphate glycosidase
MLQQRIDDPANLNLPVDPGVTVAACQTNEFPAFFIGTSGCKVEQFCFCQIIIHEHFLCL